MYRSIMGRHIGLYSQKLKFCINKIGGLKNVRRKIIKVRYGKH